MNIDQLPNGLRQLALVRRYEFENNNALDLEDAFDWDITKEGLDFWCEVNDGNFNVYTDSFPTHNWIEDYPGEYRLTSYDSKGNVTIEKIDAASIGTKIHEEMEGLVITPAVLANGYYAGEDQPKEVREAWAKGYEYACRHLNLSDIMYVPNDSLSNNPPDGVFVYTSTTLKEGANLTGGSGEVLGIKDNNQKISYQEIDFNFIDLMAASMTKNKDKYPPFNWHKPINKLDLVDAILRHTRKVKQPIEGDVETAEEHLVNIACNSMMLWFQYVNHK